MSDAPNTDVKFLAKRPKNLRTPGLGHPLRYIIRKLDKSLRDLTAMLGTAAGMRVLDFGCGDGHNRSLFDPATQYLGADLPGNPVADVEILSDGRLSCETASFDAVLSAQVLEHVLYPELYLQECARVLKPGGRLLLSTHGMMIYHRDPVDLWRWTNEGLRLVVERAGLEIIEFRGIMGLAPVGLQLFQFATYPRVPGWLKPLYALTMQSLIALFDRMHSDRSRTQEALVFALIASKPLQATANTSGTPRHARETN